MQENQTRPKIGFVRGGAIGLVSGIKGGAAAGAIGGVLLILTSTYQVGFDRVLLLAILYGLLFGGMSGVLAGAVQGVLSGAFSGILQSGRPSRPYRWVWLLLGGTTGGLISILLQTNSGWFILLAGIGCGLLAGFIGQRDFSKMVELQAAEGDPELSQTHGRISTTTPSSPQE